MKTQSAGERWEEEIQIGRWMEGHISAGIMPLSRSLRHKTEAAAGWHSNAVKESYFLGGETEALPLERVSKRQMQEEGSIASCDKRSNICKH